MKQKNLTPFLFGTKLTSLQPPQPQMTVIVRGAFKIRPGAALEPVEDLMGQGMLSAETFHEDDAERAGECTRPSDFADFKLHAEVMLAGSCHTPGGRPMAECPVRLSVGGWSKSLMVMGRRTWTEKILGAAISDPQTFTAMPIGYRNAFGGPGYALNPAGKGRDSGELPNVELPGDRVRGKGDNLAPAGFGPLNPAWPQRAGKQGKDYGRKWQKERAPFYSTDFDWTHFNAAPADQQLKDYLRGDEEVGLLNLHPTVANLTTRLPGLRVRVFVKCEDGSLQEPPMKLDTLFVDLEKEQLVLTWRGIANVKEDDFTDVQTVVIGSEPLDSQPLPESRYRQILEEFEADPLEMSKHGIAKAGLESLQAAAKDAEDHPERSPLEQAMSMLDHIDPKMVPEEQRGPLTASVAQAKEKFAAQPALPAAPPAAPHDASPGELLARAAGMLDKLTTVGVAEKDVAELKSLVDSPELQAAVKAAEPVKLEEVAPGRDLSGRNLSELDLTGRDLSGCNLEGAILFRGKLGGARLVGAKLKKAVLAKADLTNADLTDADLTQTILAGAVANGAKFIRAKFDQTVLEKAELKGADLSFAAMKLSILSGADLTDAKLHKAQLTQCAATGEGKLGKTDFTEATLAKCIFSGVTGEGVIFVNARISNTNFMQSELRKADFSGATGEGNSFISAQLEGAVFRLAVLPAAHFMSAKAKGANFFGADLRRSEFYRATLEGAMFEKSNLFGATFNKSKLSGTRFVDANLYDSRFLGASGKGTDFNGANLTRAMLPS